MGVSLFQVIESYQVAPGTAAELVRWGLRAEIAAAKKDLPDALEK